MGIARLMAGGFLSDEKKKKKTKKKTVDLVKFEHTTSQLPGDSTELYN